MSDCLQNKHALINLSDENAHSTIDYLTQKNLYPIVLIVRPANSDIMCEWNKRLDEMQAINEMKRIYLWEQRLAPYLSGKD
jgi:hypothetical protein